MLFIVKCIVSRLYVSLIVAGNLHFAYVEADDATASGETYACYLKNRDLDDTNPGRYVQLTVTRGLPCKLLFGFSAVF